MKRRNAMDLLSSAKKTISIVFTAILIAVITGPGIAHADLTGFFVTVDAPQPIPATTFDLVFKMTLVPNDGEFVDRLKITLPDGWTINSLTAPPPNSFDTCPGVDTQTRTTGQTAVWEIAGLHVGGSTCGPWMQTGTETDLSFIANVTVPDCSATPWGIPWEIQGDTWSLSAPPHDISGTLTMNNCVVPTISTAGSYHFTTIDHPDALVDGQGTQLTGINNNGLMVGHYQAAGFITRGFLYDGTTFFPIDYPGAANTAANAINDSGHIVGVYGDSSGNTSGFLHNDSTYTSINRPTALSTWIHDINNSDHVAGMYVNAGGYYGFYNDGSSIKEINYPGNAITFPFTFILGINSSNDVVGSSLDSAEIMHGFLYNGTHFTHIFYPLAIETTLNDIKGNGTIIGMYRDSDNKKHGFIFNGISRYTRLDYPGAEESLIAAINENGDMVGSYQDSSGTHHGYFVRKFSWPLFYPAIIRKK